MKLSSLVAAALAAACVLPAAAQSVQFPTSDAAIRYRQGAFSVMGAHFSRIAMMSQGIQPYDQKAALENANLINSLARLPFSAFGMGTEKGAPNRAKDEIWKEPAKFKAAADRMIGEVGKLEVAAKGGDFEALRAASEGVAKSCKSCHDEFRGGKRE